MCTRASGPDLLLKVTLGQNSSPLRAWCTCSIVQIVPLSLRPDTGRHRLSVSKILPLETDLLLMLEFARAGDWCVLIADCAKTGESLADSSMTPASEEAASIATKVTMRLVDREVLGIVFPISEGIPRELETLSGH